MLDRAYAWVLEGRQLEAIYWITEGMWLTLAISGLSYYIYANYQASKEAEDGKVEACYRHEVTRIGVYVMSFMVVASIAAVIFPLPPEPALLARVVIQRACYIAMCALLILVIGKLRVREADFARKVEERYKRAALSKIIDTEALKTEITETEPDKKNS